MDKIKGLNPSLLPPCQAALIKQMKWTNYVSFLWITTALPLKI